MKRIFSFCISVFAFALFFYNAPFPVMAESQQGGSSVWKISRNGNSIIIGGSVHILREEDYPLPKEFETAFEQSEALVLEADVEQMENENVKQFLLSKMFMNNGQTLESLLDSDTYEMLSATAGDFGIPIENLSNMKPSMLMMMLASLQMQALGFSQEGIDSHFLKKADSENKPFYFFETVEQQINMLVSMGEGYENEYVRYSLLDMENTEEYLTDIINDWKTGESATTEKLLKEMQEQWPLIYKTLIIDRNNEWIPQIEGLLDKGTTYYIIVGLAHIHGPDGLMRALKEHGCTIEQF